MRWRVACSVPGCEAAAVKALLKRDILAYSPFERITEHRTVRRSTGRTRPVTYERRLFGSYIFARTDDRDDLLAPREVDRALISASSGEMLYVRPRQMQVLLDNMANSGDDDHGLVKAVDRTKISLGFAGKVGDLFEFSDDAGSAAGYRGVIVAVDGLDDRKTVDVEWIIFGRLVPMTVPHGHVGNIVQLGVDHQRSAGARRMAGAAA